MAQPPEDVAAQDPVVATAIEYLETAANDTGRRSIQQMIAEQKTRINELDQRLHNYDEIAAAEAAAADAQRRESVEALLDEWLPMPLDVPATTASIRPMPEQTTPKPKGSPRSRQVAQAMRRSGPSPSPLQGVIHEMLLRR